MNLDGLRKLRSSVQRDAMPASSQVRRILGDGLREELLLSGVFTDLAVSGSSDPDRHLVVVGLFGSDLSGHAVAEAVERAWDETAFRHWRAGAFDAREDRVEFQGLSLDRPGGCYLTVHLVLLRSPAPAGTPVRPALTLVAGR